MNILSLDFEGTHKNPALGCPIQLGAAIMDDGGNVFETLEFLIKPPVHYKTGKPIREVDAYALRVSGLTLEQIEATGNDSSSACCKFGKFVTENGAQNYPVLAFNFSYDNACYRQLLFDGGYFDRSVYPGVYRPYDEILSHKWLCASSLARKVLAGRLDSYSLDSVAEYFGLTRETESHNALADAILAGKVYANLLSHKP